MDASVLEYDNDSDDQNGVAHDLRNRVLQRPVETGVFKKSLEQKTLGSGREPKHHDQKPNQHENLDQAEIDSGQTGAPRQWNSGRIYRADGEENECNQTQDRGGDRNQVRFNSEATKEPANEIALQNASRDQTGNEPAGESDQTQTGDMVTGNIEKSAIQQTEVHSVSVGASRPFASPQNGQPAGAE